MIEHLKLVLKHHLQAHRMMISFIIITIITKEITFILAERIVNTTIMPKFIIIFLEIINLNKQLSLPKQTKSFTSIDKR